MGRGIDSRSVGLDAGLTFIHWLTGSENMHYGLWDDLDVAAANLGLAQERYTEKLFSYLPKGPLRILDIGGGAGETARKLIALGHSVEIVVPSPFLAQRCRENAPDAVVHECKFEDLDISGEFDLCLFSESFQYIDLGTGLKKALSLLADDGEILIADCFRSEEFRGGGKSGVTGGGHRMSLFRDELATLPLKVVAEEDISTSVAPSIDLEQGLFNVVGYAISRVDSELAVGRPKSRWCIQRLLGLLMNDRKRHRLNVRLNEKTRNSEIFLKFNHYLILRLKRS